MSAIWRDFLYGARGLAKAPMLAGVASLTLGLAVAANSVIFSFLDTLYFRPPAVEEPESLARLYTGVVEAPQDRSSFPEFEAYRDQLTVFSRVFASGRRGALLQIDDSTEMLMVEVVSRDYFDALGVALEKGRAWRPDARDLSDEQRVVISHDLWRRRFGSDPDIAGKPIRLNGHDLAVGGVLPGNFQGLDRLLAVDAWISLDTWSLRMGFSEELARRESRWLDIWGRLAPEATVEQAGAECSVAAAALAQSHPEANRDRVCSVVLDVATRRRRGLAVSALLMSLAGLVLLVCCANIANLLLAQSEARRREMATRSALGASRFRIASQVATESLLLAAIGGAFGLVVASWLIEMLPAAMPETSLRFNLQFAMDGRIVGLTSGVALLATAVFGTVPALHAARIDPMSVMRSERSLEGSGRSWLTVRNILVAGQVAACVMLLTVSGLLIRSLVETARIHPGFERKPMLMVSISAGLADHDREEWLPLFDELKQRLEALPGVERTSYAMRAPLSPMGGGAKTKVVMPHLSLPDQDGGIDVKYNAVEPAYFATIGARILRGRGFKARDRQGSQPVTLISQAMAERFWGDADPIGDVIRVADVDWEIVGVVEDVKINRIREPVEPYLYLPFAQRPRLEAALLLETTAEPLGLAEPVRRVFRDVAPGVPILELATQEQLMRLALYNELLYARLASTLGLLGLFLAAIGLFGVISYLVQRRTNEIGLRLALGAPHRQVLLSFVRTGLFVGAAGVAVGSSGALVLAGLLSEFLHGVSARDPLSFLGAAGLVLFVTACASYLPARAALRVDPMDALRHN